MVCFAEVASQFSEPGGPYLYVRTAFGPFLGIQIGWFHLLGDMLGVAALAALFVNYATTFLPWHLNAWERASMMGILLVIPAAANCLGVRSGANFSNVLTVAKLSPLVLLILLGVTRFAHQPLLATVGLYGVTAYAVVRRTSEIGIRMALGAERIGVVAMVMRGVIGHTLLGLAIGIPVALLCMRFVKTQLYEVTGMDAGVLADAIVPLTIAACVAGLIPARRAASTNPAQALRTE